MFLCNSGFSLSPLYPQLQEQDYNSDFADPGSG